LLNIVSIEQIVVIILYSKNGLLEFGIKFENVTNLDLKIII